MDPGEETQPFSDILHTIKTLIEPTIKCRDIESKDYDKVFREAYSVIHLDESCAEKLRTLIQTKNAEALVKDAVQAVKFRDEGNKYFKEEKYSEALNCYNQSLLVAPCPQHFKQKTNFEEFALSLTNRFKSDFLLTNFFFLNLNIDNNNTKMWFSYILEQQS